MDLKPLVARIASDADLRARFVRNVPGLLDRYFLSGSGEIQTEEEANKKHVFNYLNDGLDFVSQSIRKV